MNTDYMKNSISRKLETGEADRIIKGLEGDSSYKSIDIQYAKWAVEAPFVKIIIYNSGKLLIQGKSAEALYDILFPMKNEKTVMAGLDEVGKGDFFGPMVTACVAADVGVLERWRKKGVRDSKNLNVTQIKQLAKVIRDTKGCTYAVFSWSMEEYNEEFRRVGNLNIILAKQHWQCLEEVLREKDVDIVVLDKFADEGFINRYKPSSIGKINMNMMNRAESNVAVAAASILAKESQLIAFEKLSKSFGVTLPRGCGAAVKDAARNIIAEYGCDILDRLAKTHFKTYNEVDNSCPII